MPTFVQVGSCRTLLVPTPYVIWPPLDLLSIDPLRFQCPIPFTPSFHSARSLDSKTHSYNQPLANSHFPSLPILPSFSTSEAQSLNPALSTLYLSHSHWWARKKSFNYAYWPRLQFMTTNLKWVLYPTWQAGHISLVNWLFHHSIHPRSRLLIS